MRNLNIYLLSVHLSNANYEQDTGLDVVEKSCFKKPPTFFPSFHFKQIPTTTTSTLTVSLRSLSCLKAGGGFCAKLKMVPNSLSSSHQEVTILHLTLWIWPHLVTCSTLQNVAADSMRVLSLGSIGFAVFALVLLSRLDCWKDHMDENPGQWSAKYQMCEQGHYGPLSPSWPTR